MAGEKHYHLAKRAHYATHVLIVLVLALIWLPRLGSEAQTYLGLVSARVAFALRDPLTKLLGWRFIERRRPRRP